MGAQCHAQVDQTSQGAIDSQVPDCDIYLGILRTHFGTPTGNYGSGTEQEFRAALERFDSQGKPWVSFYFYSGPVQLQSREEREQYDKVCEFREELERKSRVWLADTKKSAAAGMRSSSKSKPI